MVPHRVPARFRHRGCASVFGHWALYVYQASQQGNLQDYAAAIAKLKATAAEKTREEQFERRSEIEELLADPALMPPNKEALLEEYNFLNLLLGQGSDELYEVIAAALPPQN